MELSLSSSGVNPRRFSFATVVVASSMLVYVMTLWVIEPAPVSLVIPLGFAALPALVVISRGALRDSLAGLRVELVLAAVMLVLALLSMWNSIDPARAARIIFPCLLPMLLAPACAAWIGRFERPHVWVGRGLIAGAVIFCVGPFLACLAAPSLKGMFFDTYRFCGLFENSIQCALGLSMTVPLLVGEATLARGRAARAGWTLLLAVIIYVLFRTGSKFPLMISFVTGAAVYSVIHLRQRHLGRIAWALLILCGSVLFLWAFGLQMAYAIDPQIGERLEQIFHDGVSSYHSIQSRKLLWQSAIDEGTTHWLIGSGAGEEVLGLSHAHNVVLDYFKGIGLFGAAAVLLLCLFVGWRLALKTWAVLRVSADDEDVRIWIFYLSAFGYVVCNQLSDSFGPSTIGFFWVLYVMAVVCERSRRRGKLSARPSSAPPPLTARAAASC